MVLNPMEQFAVKPMFSAPLFDIAGHPIFFTNQALLMIIVVLASSLFLTLAVKPGAAGAHARSVDGRTSR